ncbi:MULTISPECIES: hypothetical protein [Symbiopectobacterium]|uniref:hypothetical protein n=1 Tax=Symbiopectobacterium TaxID=801 RepID=UPI00207A64EE|nr:MULTISPECIES: hypothetical protein [Symbiopectobacterium]MBT9430831.1 hypothetical protein [Candidatus Symbiopectobacterium endolongispinus]
MILGWFCYVWMMNIFTTFLPLYLMKTQNIELKALGIYASIPYFGGIVGAIGGGYLSKWLMKWKFLVIHWLPNASPSASPRCWQALLSWLFRSRPA